MIEPMFRPVVNGYAKYEPLVYGFKNLVKLRDLCFSTDPAATIQARCDLAKELNEEQFVKLLKNPLRAFIAAMSYIRAEPEEVYKLMFNFDSNGDTYADQYFCPCGTDLAHHAYTKCECMTVVMRHMPHFCTQGEDPRYYYFHELRAIPPVMDIKR